MDLRVLILISILCVQIRAESSSGSIVFLESSSPRFLRTRSSDVLDEEPILLSDVAAAVSVLLGFAPPASLSDESAAKLNEILLPNPFERPRAAFVLEVHGAEDKQQLFKHFSGPSAAQIGSGFRSGVLGSSKAEIQLPDADEVAVVSLNEPIGFDCDAACSDKEIHELASWLGGSYIISELEPLNGELTVPLTSGSLKLHMSKNADKEFALGLVYMIHNIRRAVEMHEEFSGSMQNPAELMTGHFTGIKALHEQYGPDGITQQGKELLLTSLTKLFDSLQAAYKGQIVGVFFFRGESCPESGSLLDVKFSSRPSSRWLEEQAGTSNSTTAALELLLVRRSIAWITGIILLIATLVGIHFLLNMPLTRDTLLYSNVKLD
ncbi:uncharacterized protein LOC122091814 isoform X2 [Macadamia integrifolia]|uniref:uncharacterized protein LOC122091814 isoform X2 n=1 Tax=Macadamia integrifolia TaxID=60698 RepID=UPI001C4E461E|nr:uncharacterized protein LOC122091814 isoform X2 [Macadamia integrifolia]